MNLSRVACGVVPVLQEHHRIGTFDRDLAGLAGLERRAVLADHRDGMAGDRLADGAGLEHAELRAGAEHQIAFGLAVEFVDREAEGFFAPFQRLDAERFAARGDAAQFEIVAAARVRRRAHHAQRGRRDEGVARLRLRHQREGALRIELVELVGHHRHAVVQARQQRVEQAAGPGPIGRRPVAVARLREWKMRQLDAGKMTEQNAMGVQRALGLAGGAGGVDHHRRIVGGGIDRREIRRGARQQIRKAVVDRNDAGELRHLSANAVELGEALRVGDERLGAGILQAIAQRIRAEQHRDRQRDRAELVDRDMGGGDFRRLRQHDGDAVAARNAVRAQHVGEPVRHLAQGAVADGVLAAVGAHMQDGEPAGLLRRPAVADIDADIVTRRHLPAELAIDVVVGFKARQHRHGAQS